MIEAQPKPMERKMQDYQLEQVEPWHMIGQNLDPNGEPLAKCPMCHEYHKEESRFWRVAHEAALSTNSPNGWVCSDKCAADWENYHWDHIEEFEARRSK